VNYVWTGYIKAPGGYVTPYEERAPYGVYLFDKAGTFVARLVGLGNGVISSIALTDSLLVLGSVGRVSVYSMSEIAQQAMLEATGAIEKAKLSGANVQAAEQSLNTAKSTAFWFDAYLLAKQATSFALQSESQTRTEVTQTSSLSQMTFTAMFGTRQVVASNVSMILLASEPGGCHVQDFPFSATKGEQIFVQFGTNGPVNFFFMTEAAYQTWSKTGSSCDVSGAILDQHSVKEFDQGLEPIIVPADGSYEFLFMNMASSPVAVTFHSDMAILRITSTRSEVNNQQSSIVTEAAAGLIVVTAVVAISVILSRRRMASRSSHRAL